MTGGSRIIGVGWAKKIVIDHWDVTVDDDDVWHCQCGAELLGDLAEQHREHVLSIMEGRRDDH